jgi:hypothetical protein
MAVKRKSYKKIRKGGKKSMRRMSKGGRGMAPMNPTIFPTPLPEANPGLDAAFALAQDPLNRALMSGGKRRKSRKGKRGGRGIAPMNPAVFPTPLPEHNPGLDAAFALAQDPLNRALMSGGKRRKSRKGKRGGRGMAPMNPAVFPTPLPEANPGLDAAFALAQDPLNRALMSGGAYQQGYNARLDESLARRHPGKKSKYSTRRKQSKGMERYLGRRPYASVSTMYKRRKRKGKNSRGGNKLMENVRLLQNQAFIKGQTNPLFRALSHSGGSPAPIPPNRVQPADSNNWWVGENGQTFFAPTRQSAFRQSMALGNHPATKSMKQNRWVPFTR